MTHDKNTRFRKAYRPAAADNRTPIAKLLALLDGAKPTGPGRWIACCPAHNDRRPSLSVRETEDGTALLHCFAGCGAQEITAALGLSGSDLFPPSDRYSVTNSGPMRKPFDYRDALTGVSTEAITVRFIAAALARGETLDDSAINRLALAEQRISDALSHAGGAKC